MVGRGTPEPKRSGTSRKTSNGNGGRTENPPVLDVGSVNIFTSCCRASSVVVLSFAVVALTGRRRLFPLLFRRRPFPCKNSNYLLTSRKISAILLLQRSGRLCECRFLYDVDTPLIMCFHRPSKTLLFACHLRLTPFCGCRILSPVRQPFSFLDKKCTI